MRQLFIGLISLAVLSVSLAGVFAIGGHRLTTQISENNQYSTAYTEFINLLALTQELRRREKDFFLRKDTIYAKQYEHISDQALAQIKKLQGFNIDKVAAISRLSELLLTHRKEFMFAVSLQETIGFDLEKGIQGKMREYIHSLEDILVKIKNEKLTLLLFTLRRNEKNFLLKMQTAPDQSTPEVAKDFETYLKSLPLKGDVKDRALEQLANYLREFRALVAKENALQKSTASLSSTFVEVEKLHFQLLNETRTNSEYSYDRLLNFVNVFWIICVTLAILFALIAIVCAASIRSRQKIL